MPDQNEFEDATEFFTNQLRLPVNGKTYVIPDVDIELGLELLGVLNNDADSSLAKAKTVDLYKRLLGPVWDQMLADKVPIQIAIRVGETALVDATQGRALAKLVWKHGISPEALAAKKAAAPKTPKAPTDRLPKQAKKKTRSTRSPRMAAENATPSPASTSGTSSPTATQPSPAPTQERPAAE